MNSKSVKTAWAFLLLMLGLSCEVLAEPIIGGKSTEQKLNLNAGRISASGPAGTSWALFQTTADGQRKRVASEVRAVTTFLLPAAVYEVEAKLGKKIFLEEVDLGAGGIVDVEAVFTD